MITLTVNNPTELFLELGLRFFSKTKNYIDVHVGDRRHVSISNIFTVTSWPKEWTGWGLFKLVGYSDHGHKLTTLRKTYVDEERLKKLVKRLDQHKGYEILGVPFSMTMEKKGGCLSSFHLLREGNNYTLFIHGKVAEVPRKFMADLLLTRDLLHELNQWPIKVIFFYSTIYFSIITARAFIPILGYKRIKNSDNYKDWPIEAKRNYQLGTQESLGNIRKVMVKKYGGLIINHGLEKFIISKKGELK